jgi:hypothetical protein
MMGSAMVVSLFVGRAITATGKYKIYPVLGGVGMAVAMWLLSTMDVATPTIGGSFGVSLFGAVFNNHFSSEPAGRFGAQAAATQEEAVSPAAG